MKSFDPWKSVRIAVIFLGVFVLSQMFFQPRSVVVLAQDNQDIDDVMQQFDADFGFQGKEDLKQSNLQDANEQNREDIKIQQDEERRKHEEQAAQTTTPATTPTPTATSNVMVSFASIGGANSVSINLGAILGFAGILPASPAIQVVTFLAVPQGNQALGIMCTSGTCNLNAASPVNVSCAPPFPLSTGPFSGSVSFGCVVS